MMRQQNKTLGIQQRIPLDILLIALQDELTGGVNEVRLRELLQSEYKGANRVNKSINQIKSVVSEKNKLMTLVNENKEETLLALQTKSDRNLILTALICSRYSFCYDLLVIFGKQFRLQDEISKPLLTKLIGAKYGFNRSCENSTYCAIPQFNEAELITRSKVGVYEMLTPQKIQNDITWQIWKECFFINEPLYNREETENLSFEPFFKFVIFNR
ncbi:MAG TPA: hypothetical protein GXZ56_11190 [Bacteroidales bacterium]|nr:hypothetical protein [Bacteroidales bacterium]